MHAATHSDALSAELETALLRALREAWRDVNGNYFRGKLVAPTIVLSSATTRLGLWHEPSRTLELSRALVLGESWGAVLEVLKHEVAHQYVHEVLGVRDETAHGPAFRDVCARLGIDGTAAGLPSAAAGGGDAPAPASVKILARIAKLLALAQSPNEHEAQLAMAEAQRLMLRHNLEAAPRAGYAYRHLGEPSGRIGAAERLLGTILGEHFFVQVIWVPVWRPRLGRRATVLEACGTPENLELAAYVHAFLGHTAERLWREYRRHKGLRSNADRRTFLAGVMIGFRDKLGQQRAVHEEQGLVWVGDADLATYYRRRHPRIRMTRQTGPRRTEAHAHGREAGRQIVIHRGVTTTPGDGGPRLLEPRRG